MGAYLLWQGGAASLFFDVVPSETQVKSNSITEHPVETGADISDHVRPNLDSVTLEGFVSNTPLFSADGHLDQVNLDIPAVPQPVSLNSAINAIASAFSGLKQVVANVMTFASAPDYVAQTISTLDQLRTSAELLTIVCPSRIYNNMLIESFEVHRDPSSGTGATFNVELKEIRTVTSSITQAPEPARQE